MEFPESHQEQIVHTRKETTEVDGQYYDVDMLKTYAEELPIETLPLSSLAELVSEHHQYWDIDDGTSIGPYEILKNWDMAQRNPLWEAHVASIKQARLDNPIWIYRPTGMVFDGAHRLTRAFLDGKDTIKVRQWDELPKTALTTKTDHNG